MAAKVALVFPGQGSQKVGMGRELYDGTELGRQLFEQADAVLGFPLAQLCFEGPEETLTRTENAQPALFTVGVLAARLLAERGLRPAAVAGHSLGEYSALAAAGALSFEDGLRTVRKRGELMAEIGDRVAGTMAAILNLSAEVLAEVCAEASSEGKVEVANYNSPDQTVISGEIPAVERAMALAKERGARRALKLSVAAPFHSSLMAPMAEELGRFLAGIEVRTPAVPVVANVTADFVRTPEEIRAALTRQVAGSVRWTETVVRLHGQGIETFVEAGPGRVLTGLAPRIVTGVTALDTVEALAREWEA